MAEMPELNAATPTIEDIGYDIGRVCDLLDVIINELDEFDRTDLCKVDLMRIDRATSLAWIGREFAEKMRADFRKNLSL